MYPVLKCELGKTEVYLPSDCKTKYLCYFYQNDTCGKAKHTVYKLICYSKLNRNQCRDFLVTVCSTSICMVY